MSSDKSRNSKKKDIQSSPSSSTTTTASSSVVSSGKDDDRRVIGGAVAVPVSSSKSSLSTTSTTLKKETTQSHSMSSSATNINGNSSSISSSSHAAANNTKKHKNVQLKTLETTHKIVDNDSNIDLEANTNTDHSSIGSDSGSRSSSNGSGDGTNDNNTQNNSPTTTTNHAVTVRKQQWCCNNKKRNSTTNDNETQEQKEQLRKEKELYVPALMKRSYHLPGYTYRQDLIQYMTNTHPIIGICYHHPLHPVNVYERIIALIGSVLFGLVVTNVIYLLFVYTNINYNETYVQIPTTNYTQGMTNIVSLIEQSAPAALSITNGNIALWTIGSIIHSLYDTLVWKLASCVCCLRCYIKKQQHNKNKNNNKNSTTTTHDKTIINASLVDRHDKYGYRGTLLLLLSVVAVVALSTLVVTIRNAYEQQEDTYDEINALNTTDTDVNSDKGKLIKVINNVRIYQKKNNIETSNSNSTNNQQQQYTIYAEVMNNYNDNNNIQFMLSFTIELVLNYFVYQPLVAIIMFTGIVTCRTGKYKLCGGRPYSIRCQEIQQEQQQQQSQQQVSTK